MKVAWSKEWVRSKQPRKQRKYRYNAPLHVKQKFMRAPLSKELRKRYSRRNARVVVGDKVRVLRGKFKKQEGEVSRVDMGLAKIFVKGIGRKKVSGAEVLVRLDPSKVMITELKAEDQRRMASLKKGATKAPEKK